MEKEQIFNLVAYWKKKKKEERGKRVANIFIGEIICKLLPLPRERTLMRFWMKIPIPCAKELKIRMRIIDEQSSE